MNLFRRMFEEDLTTLNKLSSSQSKNTNFGDMAAKINPETVSQLDKWMTTMSPEYFEKEVANRKASFPKKLVTDMYNEIVNESEIESEQLLSLVEALKMPLQEKPSDALITEISNSFVNFILRMYVFELGLSDRSLDLKLSDGEAAHRQHVGELDLLLAAVDRERREWHNLQLQSRRTVHGQLFRRHGQHQRRTGL